MDKTEQPLQTNQQLAVSSLVIGILGAALTGWIHYRYGVQTPLDLSGHGFEFYLLFGTSMVIVLLAAADLFTGSMAIRHLPTTKSKRIAVAGVVLGMADLFPALFILTIIVGMYITRFFVPGQFIEF